MVNYPYSKANGIENDKELRYYL